MNIFWTEYDDIRPFAQERVEKDISTLGNYYEYVRLNFNIRKSVGPVSRILSLK